MRGVEGAIGDAPATSALLLPGRDASLSEPLSQRWEEELIKRATFVRCVHRAAARLRLLSRMRAISFMHVVVPPPVVPAPAG